jgi:hypothetical protein
MNADANVPPMSETQTEEPVLCHCGQPLHFTDPMIEAYFTDLVRVLGPTVKIQAGGKTFEVQRYYVALHGLKAAELPGLGFPEVGPPESLSTVALVEGAPDEAVNGIVLGQDESLEPAPGPLEGDESDEALLMYQEASEALRPRGGASETTPRSPMRSVLPIGARSEGFRAVGKSHYGDIIVFVLPVGKTGQPLPEGADSYEEAQSMGDEMLNGGTWTEYRIEKFFYLRAE